jgi:hypothetical protein
MLASYQERGQVLCERGMVRVCSAYFNSYHVPCIQLSVYEFLYPQALLLC